MYQFAFLREKEIPTATTPNANFFGVVSKCNIPIDISSAAQHSTQSVPSSGRSRVDICTPTLSRRRKEFLVPVKVVLDAKCAASSPRLPPKNSQRALASAANNHHHSNNNNNNTSSTTTTMMTTTTLMKKTEVVEGQTCLNPVRLKHNNNNSETTTTTTAANNNTAGASRRHNCISSSNSSAPGGGGGRRPPKETLIRVNLEVVPPESGDNKRSVEKDVVELSSENSSATYNKRMMSSTSSSSSSLSLLRDSGHSGGTGDGPMRETLIKVGVDSPSTSRRSLCRPPPPPPPSSFSARRRSDSLSRPSGFESANTTMMMMSRGTSSSSSSLLTKTSQKKKKTNNNNPSSPTTNSPIDSRSSSRWLGVGRRSASHEQTWRRTLSGSSPHLVSVSSLLQKKQEREDEQRRKLTRLQQQQQLQQRSSPFVAKDEKEEQEDNDDNNVDYIEDDDCGHRELKYVGRWIPRPTLRRKPSPPCSRPPPAPASGTSAAGGSGCRSGSSSNTTNLWRSLANQSSPNWSDSWDRLEIEETKTTTSEGKREDDDECVGGGGGKTNNRVEDEEQNASPGMEPKFPSASVMTRVQKFEKLVSTTTTTATASPGWVRYRDAVGGLRGEATTTSIGGGGVGGGGGRRKETWASTPCLSRPERNSNVSEAGMLSSSSSSSTTATSTTTESSDSGDEKSDASSSYKNICQSNNDQTIENGGGEEEQEQALKESVKPDEVLSTIPMFFRAGVLSQLESLRDERIQGRIVMLQAYCRGCLARRKLAKRRVEDVAIRCIQRNVSKYLAVRSWPWWRLYTKVAPLLNVHRTEEELKSRTEEVETLRAKVEKADKERGLLKSANDRLEARDGRKKVYLVRHFGAVAFAEVDGDGLGECFCQCRGRRSVSHTVSPSFGTEEEEELNYGFEQDPPLLCVENNINGLTYGSNFRGRGDDVVSLCQVMRDS
ncbi:unnamed protein product [Notodromas monacha]|uniref:Uncharacterized protein n=1 Tax=Notodromas monacha TaxID=399045 RepID=A0A7R9BLH0_9CRUS|nr:unnamed protein product [Notodromas monacha]CAG0916347.1 unnamed protein product [Notodromas monacha]